MKIKGIMINGKMINHGNDFIGYFKNFKSDTIAFPFTVNEVANKTIGIESLKNKKADALIIIDTSFTQSLQKRKLGDSTSLVNIEFIGDLSNTNYLISAVWANEIVNEYALQTTNNKRISQSKRNGIRCFGYCKQF